MGARSGGANPGRPEPCSARPLASQPGVEPFHRVGAAQMRGAGQRRLPKRREEKIGVADEPRLTLSDAAVRDAPAGKGAARSAERRVGNDCVSTCRSRRWTEHSKKTKLSTRPQKHKATTTL